MIRFLVALVALVAGSLNATETAINDELRQGTLLLQQGKYQEAFEVFSRASKSNPHSAQAFFLLGTVEFRMKRFKAAEGSLRSALERDPKSADIAYNLGVLLLEQNRAREASRYFGLAAKAAGAGAEVYANLLQAYLAAGDPRAAVQVSKSAPPGIRDSAAFQLAAGSAFLRHGLNKEAVDALKRADTLFSGPKDEILLPLADACLRIAELACADDALARSAAQTQNTAAFHYLRGKAALMSDQHEQAVSELERAWQQEPQNIDYILALARCYQKYGDQQKALTVLDAAAQVAPENAQIPLSIGVSYFIDDKFEKSQAFAERALKIEPSLERALFLAGLACFGQSKFEKAAQFFEKAASVNPSNPFYACFRGMTLLQLNEDTKAAISFRQAIALKPDYALPHYQLGRVFGRTRNYVEAGRELERAIALQPELTEAYYQLGMVYRRTGKPEKAAEALKQFHDRRGAEESDREQVLRQGVDQARKAMLR